MHKGTQNYTHTHSTVYVYITCTHKLINSLHHSTANARTYMYADAARMHFHFITSLVCDGRDKTVVTEMSEGGRKGGFEIEREIMYFN